MTDATSGAETVYPSEVSEFTSDFLCLVDRCLSICPFSFWLLYCLSFFDLRILITSLVSSKSS